MIPVLCDEMVPGDYWNIGNEIVVRFQPMVVSCYARNKLFRALFFCSLPAALVELGKLYNGGIDGTDASVLPT